MSGSPDSAPLRPSWWHFVGRDESAGIAKNSMILEQGRLPAASRLSPALRGSTTAGRFWSAAFHNQHTQAFRNVRFVAIDDHENEIEVYKTDVVLPSRMGEVKHEPAPDGRPARWELRFDDLEGRRWRHDSHGHLEPAPPADSFEEGGGWQRLRFWR